MKHANELAIRPAQPADAPALTRLAHAAKRHWHYPEEWIRLWAEDLTVSAAFIRSNSVYCAVRLDEIVGFYALSRQGGGFEVEHMWVDPVHIGTGVGRELFEHAVHTARSLGGNHLDIVSDPNAEGFYRVMGARPIGRIPATPQGRTLPRLMFDLTSTEVSNER